MSHSRVSAVARQDSLKDVDSELAQLALQGLLPTILASILGSGGTTALLAWQYRDPWLTFLSIATVAVCALRLSLVLQASPKNLARLSTRSLLLLHKRYGLATLIYCGTIALIILHLSRLHSVQCLCLSLIGVFCVCVGLASRTGTRPVITQTAGGMMLAATVYAIFVSDLSLRWIAAAAIVFFAYQFFFTLHNQFGILVEQLRTRRQLRILSEQDTLTGLANRRHFETSLAALCAAAQPFAILFLDLDRFKHVNDRYGHATGDALLIEVGHRLRATIRPTDLLARLGGDEFAILQTPLLAAHAAEVLAAHINVSVDQPFLIDGHRISVGASIGVRLAGSGQSDANTLLGMADQALYLVKQAGGGSFSLATA